MSRVISPHHRICVLIAVWLGLVACGLGALAGYSSTQGAVGESPQTWPDVAAPEITLSADTHTVVIAVHPRCPCTRATINELERSLAASAEEPIIYALIFEPTPGELEHADEAFARTRIAARLSRLTGVRMIPDPGSALAQRFGALTSGHTLVYDDSGSLVYSGGLTPTRAHEGPNTGSASLVQLLNGGSAVAESAPVYGCPLCPDSPSFELDICSTQEEQP
jgi:hypothetical protein